jgi:hypothetical protein
VGDLVADDQTGFLHFAEFSVDLALISAPEEYDGTIEATLKLVAAERFVVDQFKDCEF